MKVYEFGKLYIAGLIWGCMVFIYFHLACGTLIHNYNVIYEAAQGDTARAVAAWNRSYAVQAFSYWVSFVVLGIASTGGWIALVLKGILPLKKNLGIGGSASRCWNRISVGNDPSVALQRLCAGL